MDSDHDGTVTMEEMVTFMRASAGLGKLIGALLEVAVGCLHIRPLRL
jgi:hypothetical protein